MTAYIYTVTVTALAASVLVTLVGRGSMGILVKLTAGMFMALTVISPLVKLELPDPETWINGYEADGRRAAMAGEELADKAYRTFIKEQTQAYILDKASRYGACLDVDVVVDDRGFPASVMISGWISPYSKARLAEELDTELGLGEEVQQWTSQNLPSG